MEIRNLNTFLCVASLQNFTQASQRLGYSQSNVSAQIKQLEQELGFELFDRIGRNTSLTSYGEAILPYARQVISSVLQMESFMKSDKILEGTVRVGLTDSLSELLLDSALVKYHQRFPKVHLELTVDATTVLLDNLQRGFLDVACLICDPLPKTNWIIWDAIETPIVLVANPLHSLARKKSVLLKELPEQEIILMETTAPYSRQFEQTLSSNNLECKPFLRLQSADTARRLVERGLFLAVLPLYTVQDSIRLGRLCPLTVPEWSGLQYVQMVLHHSKVITPQIQGFLGELQFALGSVLSSAMNRTSISSVADD